jgi:hypothetical protein
LKLESVLEKEEPVPMRSRFFILFLFSLTSGSYGFWAESQVLAPKGAQLISASLASIDGKMLSSRDVEIAKELQRPLGRFRTLDFAVELDPLSQAVLNILAAKEAKSFQIAQAEESEVKEALLKFRGSEVFRRLGLKESETRSRVSEKILAEKFLELRAEGLRTVVTDQEIRDFYERNRSSYQGMPFDKFKDSVRKDLETENRQKRFLEWFDVLKQKYKVRIYGTPDSSARSSTQK